MNGTKFCKSPQNCIRYLDNEPKILCCKDNVNFFADINTENQKYFENDSFEFYILETNDPIYKMSIIKVYRENQKYHLVDGISKITLYTGTENIDDIKQSGNKLMILTTTDHYYYKLAIIELKHYLEIKIIYLDFLHKNIKILDECHIAVETPDKLIIYSLATKKKIFEMKLVNKSSTHFMTYENNKKHHVIICDFSSDIHRNAFTMHDFNADDRTINKYICERKIKGEISADIFGNRLVLSTLDYWDSDQCGRISASPIQTISLEHINKGKINTDKYFGRIMYYHCVPSYFALLNGSLASLLNFNTRGIIKYTPIIIQMKKEFLFKEVRNYCGTYLIPELCDIVASYICRQNCL